MIQDYDNEIQRQHEPAIVNETEPEQFVAESKGGECTDD